jgi:hypothetical protein
LVVEVTEATRKRDQAVFGGLIRATTEFARTYSEDDLRVVREFLDGARDITAAYSRTLDDPKASTTEGAIRSRRPVN